MNVLENIQNALAEILPVSTPAETAPAEEEATEAPARIPGCMLVDPFKHGSHLDVLCLPEQVVDVARIMDEQDFFLESISGVDWLDRQEIRILLPEDADFYPLRKDFMP